MESLSCIFDEPAWYLHTESKCKIVKNIRELRIKIDFNDNNNKRFNLNTFLHLKLPKISYFQTFAFKPLQFFLW